MGTTETPQEHERCSQCGEDERTHRAPSRNCRYNGHANYETWLVSLWIDNDQGSHVYWREIAQEVWDEARPGKYEWETRAQQAAYMLAKRLEDEHEEQAPTNGEANVYADLMNAALSEVDWQEIAESMLDDVDKTDDEESAE